jgi:hypothetical protein
MSVRTLSGHQHSLFLKMMSRTRLLLKRKNHYYRSWILLSAEIIIIIALVAVQNCIINDDNNHHHRFVAGFQIEHFRRDDVLIIDRSVGYNHQRYIMKHPFVTNHIPVFIPSLLSYQNEVFPLISFSTTLSVSSRDINENTVKSSSSSTEPPRRMGELTKEEQHVFDLLLDVMNSKFVHRVIVVGNEARAILETTCALGPVCKITQSPSTGRNLLTLANHDQSFEFHVQLSAVTKIEIIIKELLPPSVSSPDVTELQRRRRLIRLLGVDGKAVTTLILADGSTSAVEYFDRVMSKYGNS